MRLDFHRHPIFSLIFFIVGIMNNPIEGRSWNDWTW